MINNKSYTNFLTIFLLIFGPGLIFLTHNIANYSLYYLIYPLLFESIVFLLIIAFYYVNSIFLKNNSLNYKIIIFISVLWFLSFYFKDILLFFNIRPDEKNFYKILIIIFFIITSILITIKINLFLKKFISYLIIFLILSNFINNFNFGFFKEDQNQIYENKYFNVSKVNPIKDKNRRNVYFFLIDEFTSADTLSEMGFNIDEFIKNKIKDNFQYLQNSKSSHNSTQYSVGTIFNLEYYKTNINIYSEHFYPELLFKNEKPNLLKILKNNNYQFWMLGNQYMHCRADKYINCIKQNNLIEKIIEDEGLNVFIDKTFFNNLYYKIKSYYYNKKFKSTEIDEFSNFLDINNNIIINNNNFFFIHHINPHYPYRNENCEILDIHQRFKMNDLNYISSTECALKKINLITEKINKIDPNSIIVFQSDHGFSKFNNNDEIQKTFNILNLVKLPKICDQNLQKNLGTVETINAVFDCLYGQKRKFENPGQTYVADDTKIKFKKFHVLKK